MEDRVTTRENGGQRRVLRVTTNNSEWPSMVKGGITSGATTGND